MKITWLGQAGLLFETGDKKIVVDPYLSNIVFSSTAIHSGLKTIFDLQLLRLSIPTPML